MRDSGPDRVVRVAFWTLGVLCLLNLNDLARMWIGVDRAFSELMLLCCVLMLAGLWRTAPREALRTPGALILSCLVSYVGIGMLVAIVNGTALQTEATWYLTRHLSSALVIAATAIGGRVMWERIGGERLLLGVLVLLTGSCTLMLASPWLVDIFRNAPNEGAYRFFGSFSDPNEAALVACFAIVASLALMRRGRNYLLIYGALIVALAALVGTFSRTAVIALPVLALSALLITRGGERLRVMGGIVVTVLIMWGVRANLDASLFDERQLARWRSLVEFVGASSPSDLPIAGRVALWRLAGDRALESPVLGHGLGSFHALEGAWYNSEGVLMGAHNQYLILLGEAGILPTLLFAAFLAVALCAGFRYARASWASSMVSGWALVLIIFSLAFHGVLTQRASNFIIGLSCAVMAGCAWDGRVRPETTPGP